MAMNARTRRDERWSNYVTAGDNFELLYEEYDRAHKTYGFLSIMSYGLWIGGGASIITALFVPFDAAPAGTSEARPVGLSVVPTTDGFDVQLKVALE